VKWRLQRNEKDAQMEYAFVISDGDLENLRLSDFDRAVLAQVSLADTASSVLLALELIFRRAEEQQKPHGS